MSVGLIYLFSTRIFSSYYTLCILPTTVQLIDTKPFLQGVAIMHWLHLWPCEFPACNGSHAVTVGTTALSSRSLHGYFCIFTTTLLFIMLRYGRIYMYCLYICNQDVIYDNCRLLMWDNYSDSFTWFISSAVALNFNKILLIHSSLK